MADDLLDARFDRTPDEAGGPPKLTYVLASTPRSGSTLLSEGLRATGRLGVPAEYLNVTAMVPALSARWGARTGDEYVAALHRFRSSERGVFGIKLHWQQVEEASDVLHVARGRENGDAALAVLHAVAPNARYVRLLRRDRDRQAVSYWVALRTREWSVHGGEPPPATAFPDYDYDQIAALRARIDHGEAGWDAAFRAAGITPFVVVYEDFQSSYTETVVAVAAFLGEEVAPGDLPPPRLVRQADARSEAVLERFRADRARRGHG